MFAARPQQSEKRPQKSVSKYEQTKNFVSSLYNDPFRWQLTKSIGLFAFGIYLARDISSVKLFENA